MISCFGLNDGIVEVLVTAGGTAPYQYSDDGGLTYQSSNTFYNLAPGNHTFSVLIITVVQMILQHLLHNLLN